MLPRFLRVPQIFPFASALEGAEGVGDESQFAAGGLTTDGLVKGNLGNEELDPALFVSGDEVAALQYFHRRINRVLLDKIVMERERERLAQENDDIKSLLQQVRPVTQRTPAHLRLCRCTHHCGYGVASGFQ